MSPQAHTGLTLEGIAQRLETLERENERMRSENAELRNKVAVLEGSETRRDGLPALRGPGTDRDREVASAFGGQVSRRSLLSKAGAAAVAAVAAGTLLNARETKADDRGHLVLAWAVLTHYVEAINHLDTSRPALYGQISEDTIAAVHGENTGSGPGVKGESGSGPGVKGESGISAAVEGIATGNVNSGVEGTAEGTGGTGVKGTGRFGVWGESNQAGFYGVFGRNTNTDGTGVRGVTNDTGSAGVKGSGSIGVWGSSSKTDYGAVYGQHTGSSGYGIVGDGTGGGAGVLGRNSDGEGVRGEGSTQAEVAGVRGLGKVGVWGSSSVFGYEGVYGQHTGTGWGVVGDGKGGSYAGVFGRNNTGYGGRFEGGKAQLMLTPGGSAGKPTTGTHSKGEIYMDSRGTLFVCTAGDGTTLGSWRKVNTTAV